MINSVGFHFSPNTGKLLENLVFLTLRQRAKEVYYYVTPGGFEVDFYLPEQRQLIQVATRLTYGQTRQREFRAIEDAGQELQNNSALILSDTDENDVLVGRIPVTIRSVTEWLLDQALPA